MNGPRFSVPAEILARPDDLTKFNLILCQAVRQGFLRPEEVVFYQKVWRRGRKTVYWGRHIQDLIALLEDKPRVALPQGQTAD